MFHIIKVAVILSLLTASLVTSAEESNLCFSAEWESWMPIDKASFRDLKNGCDSDDRDWREDAFYRGWCWHPDNACEGLVGTTYSVSTTASSSSSNNGSSSRSNMDSPRHDDRPSGRSPNDEYPLYIGWETRYNYYMRRYSASEWYDKCLSVESPPPPSLVAHCGGGSK